MTSIKDQRVCNRGQVILTIILMNGKGMEFDIFHVHIAQDVRCPVTTPYQVSLKQCQCIPLATDRAPGERSEPIRPRYLKGSS